MLTPIDGHQSCKPLNYDVPAVFALFFGSPRFWNIHCQSFSFPFPFRFLLLSFSASFSFPLPLPFVFLFPFPFLFLFPFPFLFLFRSFSPPLFHKAMDSDRADRAPPLKSDTLFSGTWRRQRVLTTGHMNIEYDIMLYYIVYYHIILFTMFYITFLISYYWIILLSYYWFILLLYSVILYC